MWCVVDVVFGGDWVGRWGEGFGGVGDVGGVVVGMGVVVFIPLCEAREWSWRRRRRGRAIVMPNGPIGAIVATGFCWPEEGKNVRFACPPSRISVMVGSKPLSWKDGFKDLLWVEKMLLGVHIDYGQGDGF